MTKAPANAKKEPPPPSAPPTEAELRQLLIKTGHISASLLAAALAEKLRAKRKTETYARELTLPTWLINALIDTLQAVDRGPGRPRQGPAELELLDAAALTFRYNELLFRLQLRKKRSGLKGCKAIRNKEWWAGPPHERARRMLSARLHKEGRTIDFERLKDIISKYRSPFPKVRNK